MQTTLAGFLKDTPQGKEAEALLRKCVHCGFCLATCPTYQLLGDELDSPRGRLYLIKDLLEGRSAGEATRVHLDRCLTCRACETTCPSGVQYGRLLEIGRALSATHLPRSPVDRMRRYLLRQILSRRRWFSSSLWLARVLKPLLPQALAQKIPERRNPGRRGAQGAQGWPAAHHPRKVLVLEGCVQPVLEPGINAAAAQVLDRLGISALTAPKAGCCGALALHLSATDQARAQARRNIDAWWPLVEAGAEAIVGTASACALMVREYRDLLRADQAYAARATRLSELARDISEVVAAESSRLDTLLRQEPSAAPPVRVAFHAPCTLQHGLRIRGSIEQLLAAAGFAPTPVPDSHLCCGSAGTYSLLEPQLATQLLERKVRALEASTPALIATANIGCLIQLRSGTSLPVQHWIELLAARLRLTDTQSHSARPKQARSS
jgi:glycolate oxidase iron-sulfur subunit